jgi:hypothetical protein
VAVTNNALRAPRHRYWSVSMAHQPYSRQSADGPSRQSRWRNPSCARQCT